MAQRDLKVTLIGDDKTAGAFGSAGKNADGFGSKMKDVGKFAAIALGGAVVAGVAGFGAALFQGAKDAASYQQITDQLAQTIESTGGAAGVSVEGLKAYAGQLESISGVDEELILSSQNVLATFTNIKNGVGEGNDVFNQASEAALNLSTTMGGDLQGASVLVGKALNDPIKGVTALSRAGVQLTQGQKDTIAAMVEAGDAAGAQKIILGELETQFGGAAAAAGEGLTGSLARAKDAFSDIFREVAERALPKLAEFAEWAAVQLPVAFGAVSAFFQTNVLPAFRAVGDFWAVNGPTITAAVQGVGAAIVAAFQTIGDTVMATVNFFREHDAAAKALGVVIAGVMAGVMAAWVAQAAVATVNAATSVLAWLATATASTTSATIQSKSTAQIVVGWAAKAVAATVNAAIVVAGWVATGVGAVAAGVVHAAQVTAQVAKWIVLATAGATVNAAKVVAGWVVTSAGAIAAGAVMVAQVAVQVAQWVFLGAQSLLHAAKVAAAWLIAMGPIGLVIAAVLGVVALIIANWDTISRVTGELWTKVKQLTSDAWTALTGAVSTGATSVVSFFTGLPGRITGALGNLGSLLVNAGRELMEGLARGIGEKIEAVVGKVRDAVSLIGRLLPGSPIKDGPLKSWNGGGAGQRLMGMLADGIATGGPGVARAMQRAVDFGDVAGMQLGGTSYINGRLTATSPGGSASGTDALLRELIDATNRQTAALAAMPRDYRLNDRQRG